MKADNYLKLNAVKIRTIIIELSIFVGFYLAHSNCFSQNLIQNPSFELHTSCPAYPNELTKCIGWFPIQTPEYYHACGLNANGVPYAGWGYQDAADGVAYVGIGTFDSTTLNYKEYITTSFNPLQIGKCYEVSISVSLADRSSYGTDDLGVFFYKTGPPNSTSTYFAVSPQVSYKSYGPIINKYAWTRLISYFVADSAYGNLILGGFGDYQSAKRAIAHDPVWQAAYYYVDSVVVKLAPHVDIIYSDSLLCTGDTINVPFFANNKHFNPGNIFTLQLSNVNGNFSTSVDIGTLTSNTSGIIKGIIPVNTIPGALYRLRMVASDTFEISNDNGRNIAIGNVKPATPVVSYNNPFCYLDTLKISGTCATTGVSWYWTTPYGVFQNTTSNISKPYASYSDSGYYKAIAVLNGCPSYPDSVYVNVNKNIGYNAYLQVTPDTVALPGAQITFLATTSATIPAYQWYRNNAAIPSATANTYSAIMGTDVHGGDSICVKITNSAVCANPPTKTICSGTIIDLTVNEVKDEHTSMYPNPCSESFYFVTRNIGTLYLENIAGQIIEQYKILNNKVLIILPNGLKTGIYVGKFVSLKGDVTTHRIDVY